MSSGGKVFKAASKVTCFSAYHFQTVANVVNTSTCFERPNCIAQLIKNSVLSTNKGPRIDSTLSKVSSCKSISSKGVKCTSFTKRVNCCKNSSNLRSCVKGGVVMTGCVTGSSGTATTTGAATSGANSSSIFACNDASFCSASFNCCATSSPLKAFCTTAAVLVLNVSTSRCSDARSGATVSTAIPDASATSADASINVSNAVD